MNKDFSALLTDICETRGPQGKRMAEYLERTLWSILYQDESPRHMWLAVFNALKDPDCLEQWEEDA